MFGCENMHMFPLVGIGVDRKRERGRTALGHIIIKCLQSGLLPFPSECAEYLCVYVSECVCVCECVSERERQRQCGIQKDCMCLWECVREREKVCVRVFVCDCIHLLFHLSHSFMQMGFFRLEFLICGFLVFPRKRLRNCHTQINVSLVGKKNNKENSCFWPIGIVATVVKMTLESFIV